MQTFKRHGLCCLCAVFGIFAATGTGFGYEINDKLSIGGTMAGEWQYLSASDAPDFDDEGQGAMVFQPEISFTPTSADEVFVKLGFGAANGLMEDGRSPFTLAPWAADVEDGLKDINGRNRDYLLTAWYKHTFSFGEEHELALTGGIIDATDYLDENAFANDEFTQFMNEAFVNGPIANLASYDIGGAMEWAFNGFSVKGVGMAVGSNGEEGQLEGLFCLPLPAVWEYTPEKLNQTGVASIMQRHVSSKTMVSSSGMSPLNR